jgi:predicted unusual protein kinase regulating ubiquinone biosynthesis (AarF/ABC1/UbiB family)
MTQAVKHMHAHKIMHSDLHINNWTLKKNLDIVLLDFGCAKDMTQFENEEIP